MRLTGLTNQKGEQAFLEYNLLGRCVGQTFFDGARESYQYNPCGRIARITAADGENLEVQREGDRIVEVRSTDGMEDQFQYAEDGSFLAFSRNGVAVQLTRDPLGRAVAELQGEWTLESGYDGASRRVWMGESKGGEWLTMYMTSGGASSNSKSREGRTPLGV